jgi:hypothetical protein
MSELIIKPEHLELLKGFVEVAFKEDTEWVGGGKPNIQYTRPAKLSDINVSLVDGNEVEVKVMWYKENKLDKV